MAVQRRGLVDTNSVTKEGPGGEPPDGPIGNPPGISPSFPPAPTAPPGGWGKPPQGGNPEGPRDRPDTGPGGAPPDEGVRRVGPQATPTMPDTPSPTAGGPPSPFTPIPPVMTPGAAARPMGNLFGRAGGLLGGGLGVPNAVTGNMQSVDTSSLLQQLLKALGGGGQ